MQAGARREAILEKLKQAEEPVSAAALAADFQVSRQIIVGDVALLRAAGEQISATPRGYVMHPESAGLLRRIACCHSTAGMQDELNIIVDQGCTVLDVIVEHPVYGQLTGTLQLKSRFDVEQFLRRCSRAEAKPLSDLTEGIHLHTLLCPDEDAYARVCRALRERDILLES